MRTDPVHEADRGPGGDRADAAQRASARLLAFVSRNRRAVLAVSAIVFAALAVASSQLRIAPDWTGPFLPRSDPALVSYAEALHRFADTETVYVDVSSPDAGTMHAGADAAESRMRESGLFLRVTGRLTEADLRVTARAVGAALPGLLDETAFAHLETLTATDAVAARVEEIYERLLGPLGA